MTTEYDQTAAPTNGATGVGSNLSPTHGVVLVLLASAAVLVTLGVLTRR